MSTPHPRPYYYLENFQTALHWLQSRYADLLTAEERGFMQAFEGLPIRSRALLVRMIMRKGGLFRTSKLEYAEIGCPREAAAPLLLLGWLDDQPLLGVAELFGLLRKSELPQVLRFTPAERALTKGELLVRATAGFVERRTFVQWHPESAEQVFRVAIVSLCERLRLMFFGNFDQTWSEFVLADLGIFRYEKVELAPSARAFQARNHVEVFHALYRCRERFHRDESCEQILADVPAPVPDNPWLEGRRAKLLFRVAQRYERAGATAEALGLYTTCAHPGSRVRAIRLLERSGCIAEATQTAMRAELAPDDEVERQQVQRMMPRLRRKLGERAASASRPQGWATFELSLPAPGAETSVEHATRQHLTRPDAPVHYVENGLINSLFGLLCWDVVFMPLPGAFFHEFHSAPADLYSADFRRRREAQFAERLAQLESGQYRATILRTFGCKAGIQSPFVAWGLLTEALLGLALDCLPARHLRHWFDRILLDVKTNRAGFPDLVQFWPREKRYRMIEVKGPGDRLQDNQIRWLGYCAAHGMPVSVCHVRWVEGTS